MVWMLFDAMAILAESWMLYRLTCSLNLTYCAKRNMLVKAFILSLVLHTIIGVIGFEHNGINAALRIGADIVFLLVLKIKPHKAILPAVLLYALLLCVDVIIITLFPVNEDSVLIYFVVATIISRLALVGVFFGFHMLSEKGLLKNVQPFLTALLVLVCVFLVGALSGYELFEISFVTSDASTLFIILILLLLLLLCANQIAREAELGEQMAAQEDMYHRLSMLLDATLENFQSLRQARHDMRHYINLIQDFLLSGEVKEALSFISEVDTQIEVNVIFTGNDIIDAIIRSQMAHYEKLQVRINVVGTLPKKLPYKPFNLCTIFANVLENAAHAAANVPEERRIVDLQLRYDGWLSVMVRNPIEAQAHTGDYGTGLRGVQKACQQENGFMETTIESDYYIFRATLQ